MFRFVLRWSFEEREGSLCSSIANQTINESVSFHIDGVVFSAPWTSNSNCRCCTEQRVQFHAFRTVYIPSVAPVRVNYFVKRAVRRMIMPSRNSTTAALLTLR